MKKRIYIITVMILGGIVLLIPAALCAEDVSLQ